MNLKVLSWNCQSLRNKHYELCNFLNRNFFHLVLIQETWLRKSINMKFPNYICVRNDRDLNSQNPHGGTLILIHKSLNYKIVNLCNLDFIESTFVQISLGHLTITFGSIYCSSSLTINQSKDDLIKLLSRQGPFCLAGDFNAKHKNWNNIDTNRKGSTLLNIANHQLVDIHFSDEPTLTPDNKKASDSIVDLALTKALFNISKPLVIDDLCSDHRPISFAIDTSISVPDSVKFFNYKKADWKRFKQSLDVKLRDSLNSPDFTVDTKENIDKLLKLMNESILSSCKEADPLIKPSFFR